MPIVYHAKASIVNESSTSIERLAARIVEIANTDFRFIKTYPFVDYRNRSVINLVKDMLKTDKETPYIGISFTSYNCINFIEFYSIIDLFRLDKGSEIELYFEDETVMSFTFSSNSSAQGIARRNVHPISDMQLDFLANNKLMYWKVLNKDNDLILTGGFVYEERNKQYKSENTGRQLLKKMANVILNVKSVLN